MKRSALIAAVMAGLLPCVCVAGPKKDRTLLATVDVPTNVAFEMRSSNAPDTHAAATSNEAAIESHATEPVSNEAKPAEAEALLPDAPDVPAPIFSAEVAPTVPKPRLSLSRPQFTPAVSPLYSVPVVNKAMRLGGRNFNTDDGSSVNAFAICYRLNRRSSMQVIPGDPAPVKLPVASLANNTGVTVGMVYRLSRRP